MQIERLHLLVDISSATFGRTEKEVATRDESFQAAIEPLLEGLRLPHFDAWTIEECPKILIALLIQQCSSLETLTLDLNLEPDTGAEYLPLGPIPDALDPCGTKLSNGKNCFTALKDVEINCSLKAKLEVTQDVDKDIFTNYFYLPRLENISLEIPTFRPLAWKTPEAPRCSSLVRLSLSNCEANEESVALLLKSTPNLQYFLYDRQINVDPLRRWKLDAKHYFWNLDTLTEALLPLKEKLQELKLAFFFYASTSMEITNPSDHWGVRGRPIDFSQFTQLRTLEIPWFAYLDREKPHELRPLPPNLHELGFGDDMGEHSGYPWGADVVLPVITRLVTEKAVWAPELEFLGLVIRETEEPEHGYLYRWDEEERAQFISICEGGGLKGNIKKALR